MNNFTSPTLLLLLIKVTGIINKKHQNIGKKYNIFRLDLIYLILLANYNGGLKLKEIQTYLSCNKSLVTRTVSRLIQLNLIEKYTNDCRGFKVGLTEKGRIVALDINEEMTTIKENAFKKLTAEERKTLVGLIAKVVI